MMNDIIEYLEETYELTTSDLGLPDDERNFLMGQLALIEELKDIHKHGLPIKEEDKEDNL